MKKKQKNILIALLCIVLLSISSFTFADVGNVNRYDSGSSSSSSSSSLGSGIIGLLIGLFINHPIFMIILVGIVIFVWMRLKKAGKTDDIINKAVNMKGKYDDFMNGTLAENLAGNVVNKNITGTIQQIDPNFSEEAFLSWTRDVFVKIQQAWTARDWKVIRPFESNELFEMHSAQLQEYINNNKINMIEKIAVKSCYLTGFKQDGDKEVATVSLSAVMRDYVIDATTKEVLESDPNKDWNMSYTMTFARKAGVKTKVGTSNKSTTNCPNCGAPTQVTSAGECGYCGSVITTGEHDWVLTDIKGK